VQINICLVNAAPILMMAGMLYWHFQLIEHTRLLFKLYMNVHTYVSKTCNVHLQVGVWTLPISAYENVPDSDNASYTSDQVRDDYYVFQTEIVLFNILGTRQCRSELFY